MKPFKPDSSSKQQKILKLFLDGVLNKEQLLKVLPSCSVTFISDITRRKLQEDGSPKALEALIIAEDFSSQLTDDSRPIELLRIMAERDLQLKSAAGMMCISIHTANKHMQALKKFFKCHTTSNMIYQAIKLGFIDIGQIPRQTKDAEISISSEAPMSSMILSGSQEHPPRQYDTTAEVFEISQESTQ